MVKMLVFGDSKVWGEGDTEKGGWVERLKLNLYHDECYVYNLGICSDTSKGVLSRVKDTFMHIHTIEPEDKYIFMFSIGTNDARYIKKKEHKIIPLEKFKQNIVAIIEQSKKYTQDIIFVGLQPVDESKTLPISWLPDEFYANDDLQGYNNALQQLCDEHAVHFIPLWDAPITFVDGVHPDAQTHEDMCKKVKEYIKKHVF